MRAIAILGLVSLLSGSTAQAQRLESSIRMHVGSSTDCDAPAPPPTFLTIGVTAHLGPDTAGGISGAEFYIEGLENLPGVSISYNHAPNVNGIGNPLNKTGPPANETRRGAVAFQRRVRDCGPSTSVVELGTISIFVPSTPIPNDRILRIVGGSPPGNPDFRCPLVALCDHPAFTKVCVYGAHFVINPVNQTCVVITDTGEFPPYDRTWSVIKGLYR
jgi:hypothetical protein